MNALPPLLTPPRIGPVEEPAPVGRDAGPAPWGFWMTTIFGACVSGAYIAAQTAVVLAAVLITRCPGNPNAVEELAMRGWVLSLCLLASVPATILPTLLFAWLRRGLRVVDYLGLRPASWKGLGLGVLCVVAYGIAYDGFSAALGRPEFPGFMVNAYRTAGFSPLLWIAVVIAAPLSEEVFFRGFLFKGLEHSPVGGAGAVLLTALAWAVIHLQYDLYDITSIFLLGLLLGVFRLKTGSILPPLLMHLLNNLVSTVQVAIHVG